MKADKVSLPGPMRLLEVCMLWMLIALSIPSIVWAEQGGTRLEAIKERGFLVCGIRTDAPGFSLIDKSGMFNGLEVDLCRAIASAIFGAENRVQFSEIDTAREFLASLDIDVAFHGLTWTFAREVGNRLRFGPIYFHDGQGFLVSKKSRIASAKQLSSVTICVAAKREMLTNLRHFAHKYRLAISELVVKNDDEAIAGLLSGRCNSYSADISQLASALLSKGKNLQEYRFLPELISKEPLAPIVRGGDEQFLDVVRWAIYATIAAEELEISSSNVEGMLKSGDANVKRILFIPEAEKLGLEPDWVYHVIRNVGNYGEIFDRNVGKASPVHLERGLNNLMGAGGLLYAPLIP